MAWVVAWLVCQPAMSGEHMVENLLEAGRIIGVAYVGWRRRSVYFVASTLILHSVDFASYPPAGSAACHAS